MLLLNILLTIAFSWIFIVFFLSRLLFPLLRTGRYPVPQKIPKEMQETISGLKRESKTNLEFLKKSYDYLTKRYHGGSITSIIRIDKLLQKDLEKIWSKPGYVPCSTHNYLLRVFLLRSGYFKEEDIKIIYSSVFLNIHQYLQVKIGNSWIDIDLASEHFGCKFGEHTPRFPLVSLPRLLHKRRVARKTLK